MDRKLDLTDASDEDLRRSMWYLAQAQLASNEPNEALPLLERMIHEGGEYAERAETLKTRVQAIARRD